LLIIDPADLIPDRSEFEKIVSNHPFLKGLDRKISNVELEKAERPSVMVEGMEVILFLPKYQVVNDTVIYVLHHEFGHVADRFNEAFQYSETERSSLSAKKYWLENFLELWNVFIDSRLHAVGLFRLYGLSQISMKIDGKRRIVDRSIERVPLEHSSFLESRGFRDAHIVVNAITTVR
jgi:hypothetical protein